MKIVYILLILTFSSIIAQANEGYKNFVSNLCHNQYHNQYMGDPMFFLGRPLSRLFKPKDFAKCLVTFSKDINVMNSHLDSSFGFRKGSLVLHRVGDRWMKGEILDITTDGFIITDKTEEYIERFYHQYISVPYFRNYHKGDYVLQKIDRDRGRVKAKILDITDKGFIKTDASDEYIHVRWRRKYIGSIVPYIVPYNEKNP